MLSKILSVFLVVHFLLDFSDAHGENKDSWKDYDYIESLKSFYKVHLTEKNWRDAKQACAEEGASLFYPENSEEANAVISLWKQYQNNTAPDYTWVYLGISDITTEGKFETIDGKSISEVYQKWSPYQPDNYNGDEDCVHVTQRGNMNDITCHSKYPFICKMKLTSLEQIYRCNIQQSNLNYTLVKDIGKCYKVHTTPMNWTDAYATCRLEQSSLAMISNPLEADYLVDLTETMHIPRVKGNYQRGIYHLGFHNRFNEGWQTVKGTPLNVKADAWWDSYQPDDRDQCGSMFFNGQLIDVDCDMKSFFICEHEVDKTNLSPELEAKLIKNIEKLLARNKNKTIKSKL